MAASWLTRWGWCVAPASRSSSRLPHKGARLCFFLFFCCLLPALFPACLDGATFLPPALQGKTLQTLSLVLSNPAPKGWAVSRLDGLQATADSDPVPIRCSLIVVPANLLGQASGWGLGRSLGACYDCFGAGVCMRTCTHPQVEGSPP